MPTMKASNMFLAAVLGCALLPGAAQGVEFRVTERLTVQQGLEVSTSAAATPLLFISSTAGAGNVGIGTTNPGYKTEINGGWLRVVGTGAGDPAMRIGVYDSDNTGAISGWWFSQNNDGKMALHQNSVGDRLVIDGAGNVGIGTNAPDSKLHVSGDLIRTIAYAQGSGIDTTCDVDTACGPSALAARTLAFTKKAVSTKVRVEYTDTMRSYGGTGASCCYWEIRFNGLSCPGGAIRGLVYGAADDPHRARIVKGYCGGLANGAYTVQVYVGSCAALKSRCNTGWDGSNTWVLDAEEVN